MKTYQCVVFDWDGTLMDSIQKIVECLQAAAQDVGLPVPSRNAAKNIIGLGLHESMLAVFGDITEAKIAELVDRYKFHFLDKNQTKQPLYPAVRSGLTALDETGAALCVATGKARRGLDRVMKQENLESFFMYTRCADESRSKPHPQMLLDILEYTALNPEKVLMVGDTSYDMEMAVGASIDAIGIAHGAHSQLELSSSGANHVFDNFKDLLNWLLPRVEKVYE